MDEKRSLTKKKTSRIPLRDCNIPEARLAMLRQHGYVILDPPGSRYYAQGSDTIENCVGFFPVPLGVTTNFIVNGEEILVAMATEERSVVAAACYAAKLCRDAGGFTVRTGPNVCRGQILFVDPALKNTEKDAGESICKEVADEVDAREKMLHRHGGGLVRNEFGPAVTAEWLYALGMELPMVTIDFQMDVGNAMGANAVTRFGEALAKRLEPMFGCKAAAVICSNDLDALDGAHVTARAVWPISEIGKDTAERVLHLQRWAELNGSRSVTHNKGIMNGISAVALATGQDVRAVEAAAHSMAASIGLPPRASYPLTTYKRLDPDASLSEGGIEGRLDIRVPLGTVGGATGHPTAVWCRKLMGVESVRELAAIVGAVGLAQNFAALRSLADEGIPAAHARLRGDL